MSKENENIYSVRRASEKMGQLTEQEILQLLKDGEIFYEIEIKEDQTEDWKPLALVPKLNQKVAIALSSASNNREAGYSTLSNWTLARTGKGPFSFLQIVQFLQQQKISHDEWLIHPRISSPSRVRDLSIFSDLNIESLFEFPLLKPLFENRKNTRVEYENRAFVYGGEDFFTGSTLSLSRLGLGLQLDTSQDFGTGEALNVHLQASKILPALEVPCRIVYSAKETLTSRLGLVFEQEIPEIRDYFAALLP